MLVPPSRGALLDSYPSTAMERTATSGAAGAGDRQGEPITGPQALKRQHTVLAREGRSVCLMVVELVGLPWVEETFPGRGKDAVALVREEIEALPRAGEIAVAEDGDALVVLFGDTGLEAGQLAGELLIEQTRGLRLPDSGEELWVGASIGIAIDTPQQRHPFEVLLGVAREGAGVARSRGGECVVHSEVYALVRRRLEREHPGWFAAAPGESAGVEPSAPAAAQSAPPGSSVDSAEAASGAPPPGAESAAAAEPPGGEPAGSSPSGSAAADARREELARRLRQAIAEDVAARPSAPPRDEDLMERARRLAAEALDEAMSEREQEHRRRVELLEARIHRLVRSLEETERTLQRVLTERDTDPGVPSAYRRVQGLDAAEQHYELKRELMQRILEANLELRRQLENGGAPAA